MRLIVDLAVSVICNYLNVVRVQHMQRYNETEREREREKCEFSLPKTFEEYFFVLS
jgi:hypothetical protein